MSKLWIDKHELLEVKEVLKSGCLTKGSANEKLKEIISDYLGVPYVICLSSKEEALYLAILSVIQKVSTNRRIILIPDNISFGFNELLNQILGIEKVFVDVDPKTCNIDYKDLKKKFDRKNTIAIVISHSFGQAADMDKIIKFTNKKNIPVIENGFIGTKYKGYHCGTIGKIGCFSLETGSVLVTHDIDTARFIELLIDRYKLQMNELSAAFEISQLKKLNKVVKKRNSLARYYNKRLKEIDFLSAPYIRKGKGNTHTYQSYHCLTSPVTDRNKLWHILRENGIECGLGGCAYNKGDNSREIFNRSLTLPLFYKLKKSEIDYIIDVLKENRDKIFI
jgi:dTDP-4-amino-4,6-dideoxygalactose transaminase